VSKILKLIDKLKRGSISADELRTLMRKKGWILDDQEGSHEQWYHPEKKYPNNVFTLATHSKDLKPYQIKEAKIKVLGE